MGRWINSEQPKKFHSIDEVNRKRWHLSKCHFHGPSTPGQPLELKIEDKVVDVFVSLVHLQLLEEARSQYLS